MRFGPPGRGADDVSVMWTGEQTAASARDRLSALTSAGDPPGAGTARKDRGWHSTLPTTRHGFEHQLEHSPGVIPIQAFERLTATSAR